MKSICIKTNNENLLDYLLKELNYINIDNVCYSCNEFKYYKNIIIHYTGEDIPKFIHEISNILSCLVVDELEENILKKLIIKNYFYFSKQEQKDILNICFDILIDDFNKYLNKKFKYLSSAFSDFIQTNKTLVLNGFINFRLQNYIQLLEQIIDESVNAFVIEKEYFEFISLLKLYVNSQNSNCDLIHLIYSSENSILLDSNKKIINISDDIFKAKYLSDISFSSNDYALNSLLNLLPKKIYIHLSNNDYNDQFLNTLRLVFEDKIEFCNDCNICNIYKNKTKKTIIKK